MKKPSYAPPRRRPAWPAPHAQDLPKTQLKVVGGLSNLTAYNDYEKPFWTKTIPELSKGQVTADIKGFNEMGLKGPELLP